MTKCKQCQLEIVWINKRCLNPDMSDHWDRCSEEQFRIVRETGKPFVDSEGDGYLYQGKKHYTMRRGKVTVGDKYKPDGCTCGLPPWELCKPDCEHAIRNANV